jgi:hypothetical protein
VAARSSRLTFRRGGFQPSCDEKSNRLLRNSAAESPFLPTGGWIRPRCQRFGFVSLAGHIDQRAKASCSLYVWSPRLRASRKSHGRDVGDAKGAMLAFNSFATRSPRRASVASYAVNPFVIPLCLICSARVRCHGVAFLIFGGPAGFLCILRG